MTRTRSRRAASITQSLRNEWIRHYQLKIFKKRIIVLVSFSGVKIKLKVYIKPSIRYKGIIENMTGSRVKEKIDIGCVVIK